MAFSTDLHLEEGTATIRLDGELDSRSAPELAELVSKVATEQDVERLVLLMAELSYMSSAGLRCLLFAHQKMPAQAQIILVGTQPQVAETIRLTGFDRSITMQESAA